jgi:Skp family chaperone for outer membrane proteins
VLAAATATETIAPEAHNDRFAIEAAERVAADARAELAAIRGALEKAERDAAAARTQLDAVQRAREAADRAAAEARASLAATQQSEESARAEAVQERARRLAADRAAATTARRRSTVNLVRSRARWSRSWCYNPLIPSPASAGAGRLTGFCKT